MHQDLSAQVFDVIVAGGGSSGCVLAGRLSEIPGKRVLLIEAGPDSPPEQEHPEIRDAFPLAHGNPRFAWAGLTAEAGASPGEGRQRLTAPYIQGFGLGGGSNVNAMGADRGQPSDYDEWRDGGALGWGWEDVVPYFNKLERDQDFSGPLHGISGPIPVRRIRPAQWAPFARAIGAAFQRRGYPLLSDYNADFRDGVGSFPTSSTTTERVSASMAYLPKKVRDRPNLTIFTDSTVERLNVAARRVAGLAVRREGTTLNLQSRETVLCCGALQTPVLLMRSGVGPAESLKRLGIEPIHALPGVGQNLQNHPAVLLATHLPRASMQPLGQRGLLQNLLRYSSGYEGCPQHDMLMYPFNRSAWHPLGRRIGAMIVYVNKPYSKGSVELAGADAAAMPKVRFNLLSDRRDFERLVGGVRFALELLADSEVSQVRNEIFLPNGRIVARLARKNTRNWIQAWAAEKVLDSPALRGALLTREVLDPQELSASTVALRQLVRRTAEAAYHVCGTCKMGTAEDPEAVVDPCGRVRGMQGIRVGDASIFPSVPSANTHLTVLMAAEKIADHLKADWR